MNNLVQTSPKTNTKSNSTYYPDLAIWIIWGIKYKFTIIKNTL